MGHGRPGGERSNGGLDGGRIEGLAICSTSGTTLLAALSEEGRVPLAPFATYGTEELAGYAGEALGDAHSACLLKNHGTIRVGETVGKAYSLTEILEEMAEIYYRTRIAGDPIILGPDQVAETRAKITTYGQTKRAATETG